jgi:hypothetical protein
LLVELKQNQQQLMKSMNKYEYNANNKNVTVNVIDNNVAIKIEVVVVVMLMVVIIRNSIMNPVAVVVVVLSKNQIDQMTIEMKEVLILIQYDNYNQMINEIKDH